jgi:hypothetical protein
MTTPLSDRRLAAFTALDACSLVTAGFSPGGVRVDHDGFPAADGACRVDRKRAAP